MAISRYFRYGWNPDLPDKRDRKKICRFTETPPKVDLSVSQFMPPVFNQDKLGSCHDSITEVLTSSGWKLFNDISYSDKLATVNPITSELVYENPTSLTKYNFCGNLIVGNNKFLNFAVTPNHKMLVRKWNEQKRTLNNSYEFLDAENLGWYSGLLNRITYLGTSKETHYVIKGIKDHKYITGRKDIRVPMEAFLKFLGIFIAEGTLVTHNESSKKDFYYIQLAAVKEREKTFIRKILSEMNLHVIEQVDRFRIYNKCLYMALKELGFEKCKAPKKRVPEFVFGLNSILIKSFLLGHFMGDGCEQNGHQNHYTSSKGLADDLQRLIFLSGNYSSIYVRTPRTSIIKDGRIITGTYNEYRISNRQKLKQSIEKKKHITRQEYNDYVYCAEVPSYHTLVTRRNGQILISGNCVGQASGAAFAYDHIKEHSELFIPSRLFIYYNARDLENSIASDDGCQIRDAVKQLANLGTCKEELWVYNIPKFATKPPKECYTEALKNQVLIYSRVGQTEQEIESVLADGYPVIFGMTVYAALESAEVMKTGILPMPEHNDKSLGGHAVLLVGYDKATRKFLVRNSWGENWGLAGYFWIDYAYVLDSELCDDFWCLSSVE